MINLGRFLRLHHFLLQIKVFLQNLLDLKCIKERKLSARSLLIAAVALSNRSLISFVRIENFFSCALIHLDVRANIHAACPDGLVIKAGTDSTICGNVLDRHLAKIFDASSVNCLNLELLILLLEVLSELDKIFIQETILI